MITSGKKLLPVIQFPDVSGGQRRIGVVFDWTPVSTVRKKRPQSSRAVQAADRAAGEMKDCRVLNAGVAARTFTRRNDPRAAQIIQSHPPSP